MHIENITLKDTPFWALHIADGEGVVITGIKIRNNIEMANADGLNITSSSNVVISNCNIRGAMMLLLSQVIVCIMVIQDSAIYAIPPVMLQ